MPLDRVPFFDAVNMSGSSTGDDTRDEQRAKRRRDQYGITPRDVVKHPLFKYLPAHKQRKAEDGIQSFEIDEKQLERKSRSRSKASGSKESVSKAPGSKAPGSKAPGSKAPGSKAPGSKAPSSRAPSRDRGDDGASLASRHSSWRASSSHHSSRRPESPHHPSRGSHHSGSHHSGSHHSSRGSRHSAQAPQGPQSPQGSRHSSRRPSSSHPSSHHAHGADSGDNSRASRYYPPSSSRCSRPPGGSSQSPRDHGSSRSSYTGASTSRPLSAYSPADMAYSLPPTVDQAALVPYDAPPLPLPPPPPPTKPDLGAGLVPFAGPPGLAGGAIADRRGSGSRTLIGDQFDDYRTLAPSDSISQHHKSRSSRHRSCRH